MGFLPSKPYVSAPLFIFFTRRDTYIKCAVPGINTCVHKSGMWYPLRCTIMGCGFVHFLENATRSIGCNPNPTFNSQLNNNPKNRKTNTIRLDCIPRQYTLSLHTPYSALLSIGDAGYRLPKSLVKRFGAHPVSFDVQENAVHHSRTAS